MKTRFVLALVALLPILVACKAQDGSADAAAPSTAPAAAPAAEAATTSEGPAADAAAAAPAPAVKAPVGPAPVAGTDYLLIEGGQPFQPVAGKVEVAEVFGYVCPACARFQPMVSSWKAGLPADVNFVYVPAAFGGTWDNYARAFYAAEALGLLDKTHEAMYLAIHADQSLKGERGTDSVQDIANFYAKHGADTKKFTDTMASFGVSAKLNRSKQFAQRSQIAGTPSLIVNGKYLVKGSSWDDMLRISDHLIAGERAASAQ
jgi:thiol:disulfide interchange protein DsbA